MSGGGLRRKSTPGRSSAGALRSAIPSKSPYGPISSSSWSKKAFTGAQLMARALGSFDSSSPDPTQGRDTQRFVRGVDDVRHWGRPLERNCRAGIKWRDAFASQVYLAATAEAGECERSLVAGARGAPHPDTSTRLPRSIWVVAWASLASQVVQLVERGVRHDDSVSLVVVNAHQMPVRVWPRHLRTLPGEGHDPVRRGSRERPRLGSIRRWCRARCARWRRVRWRAAGPNAFDCSGSKGSGASAGATSPVFAGCPGPFCVWPRTA